MIFTHLFKTEQFVRKLLAASSLTCILLYSTLTLSPLVTLALLMGILIIFLIFLKPIFGLLLIALVSPLNDLQRFSSELNIVRVLGLITIFSLLLSLCLKRNIFRKTPLDLPIMVLALSYLVPYFNAELRPANVSYLVSLFCMFAFYFAAVNIISTERHINWLISVLLLSGAILGVLSLYSYFSGARLFLFQDTSSISLLQSTIRGETLRQATGTSTNPNEFAVLFILLLPFSLYNVLVREKFAIKIVYMSLTCIFVLTLLATLSRSAILGIAVALAFLFLRYLKRKKSLNLRLAIMGPLLLVFFWFCSFKVFSIIQYNVIKRATLTAAYHEDRTITDRFLLYPAAVKMTLDHPFGVGYGNFSEEILQYYGSTRGAHNTILGIMGSNGIPGLVAILWFLYRLFQTLFKASISQEYEKRNFLGECFIACFIAFWIHASFHSLLQWNMVWLFFAMAMAHVRLVANSGSQCQSTWKGTSGGFRR